MSEGRAERYAVNLHSPKYFDGIEDAEIVFHAINKSGSMAMENAMREAFDAAGRSDEMLSHYEVGGGSPAFYERVAARKHRFVVGHYLFDKLEPRAERIWVTQFRHPLPKLLSSYNWLKLKHEKAEDTPYMTLEEFALKAKGVGHSLVKQFGSETWERFAKPGEKKMTAESLYHASVVVLDEQVHAISLAEKFEESLFLYARLCGLPSIAPWIRDNRNPGRQLAGDITDHEREVIEDVLQYDYKLYKYAVDRFERQLSEIAFGDNLEAYKAACVDQYKDRILTS